MGKKKIRPDGEPELFDVRAVKGKVVERMAASYFKSLMKKGWNPGFFVEIQPDDYPTLSTRLIGGFGVNYMVDGFGPNAGKLEPKDPVGIEMLERRRCVVLSKGPQDENRRIIAQDSDGWIVGLWIALLRRQVKYGVLNVQAWSFETLLDLENPDSFLHLQHESWVKSLILKEQP